LGFIIIDPAVQHRYGYGCPLADNDRDHPQTDAFTGEEFFLQADQ
jgi:hypothetical protein